MIWNRDRGHRGAVGESTKGARRPPGGGRRGGYRRFRQTQVLPHLSPGKILAQITAALVEAGRPAEDARIAFATAPEEFIGDAFDRVLAKTHGVTVFQLQLAKCRALRIAPYNVARFRLPPGVFTRLEEAFCKENLVLPVGEIGERLLIVIANPLAVSLANKIHEMTGNERHPPARGEEDLKDKSTKPAEVEADFSDVVNALGSDYGAGDIDEEDLTNEKSGPIIDLANGIIEDAVFNGTSDSMPSRGKRTSWCATGSTACAGRSCGCPAKWGRR